jgi:hypothetical protein
VVSGFSAGFQSAAESAGSQRSASAIVSFMGATVSRE